VSNDLAGTVGAMNLDGERAPSAVVDDLARVTLPPVPAGGNVAVHWAAHRGKVQRWADALWQRAYLAGATYGLAVQTAPLMTVLTGLAPGYWVPGCRCTMSRDGALALNDCPPHSAAAPTVGAAPC
jgi:hypothetical protein